MWINIKDNLPVTKKFKDGDIINKRYEEVMKYNYAYDFTQDDIHGLVHYEESEPVLVKYKCYWKYDNNFQIGIGILIKYQACPTLDETENENGKKLGLKIIEYGMTTGFMIYTPDFDGAFGIIDEQDIEEEEFHVFEWMHLPKF
jgi:hypothetical protein